MKNLEDFIVSAPGKVILFGEHAVVHDKPAIAASISLRTYMLVKDSPDADLITLEFPDIQFTRSWRRSDLPWDQVISQPRTGMPSAPAPGTQLDKNIVEVIDAKCLIGIENTFQHAAALAFLYLYLHICTKDTPAKMYIMRSTLPVGAGLGSSACFSVCLASALLRLREAIPLPTTSTSSSGSSDSDPLDLINKWSFLGECCIQGNPSGIDNSVATRGGAVMFRRPNIMKPISNFPPLRLILTNTRKPRRSAELVAGVGRLKDSLPSIITPILDSIDSISQEAYKLLEAYNEETTSTSTSTTASSLAEQLAPLIHINHALLVALGVSHSSLERVKVAADSLKIGETKLTGAGGGGCAITLVTLPEGEHCEQQIKSLASILAVDGFEVFETVIGGHGVGISSASPELEQHMYGAVRNEIVEKLGDWVYWS